MMIYPMFSLVILTILVGVVVARVRVVCVQRREVPPSYFKLMQGDDIPEIIIKTTRCFNNLFEMPTLFYVVCVLYLIMDIDTIEAKIVAWLYVLLRGVQAYIHMTSNHVVRRMYAFGASGTCLALLWINLMVFELGVING